MTGYSSAIGLWKGRRLFGSRVGIAERWRVAEDLFAGTPSPPHLRHYRQAEEGASNRVDEYGDRDAGDEKQEVLEIGSAGDGILVAGIVPKFVDGSVRNAQRRSDGDSSPVPEFAEAENDSVRGEKVRDLSNEIEKRRVDDVLASAGQFRFSHGLPSSAAPGRITKSASLPSHFESSNPLQTGSDAMKKDRNPGRPPLDAPMRGAETIRHPA